MDGDGCDSAPMAQQADTPSPSTKRRRWQSTKRGRCVSMKARWLRLEPHKAVLEVGPQLEPVDRAHGQNCDDSNDRHEQACWNLDPEHGRSPKGQRMRAACIRFAS